MRDRARWNAATANTVDPLDRLLAFFDLAAAAPLRNYRGCQYVNAATEVPGERLPMLEPVRAHRSWARATMTSLLDEAGVPRTGETATRIQVIYDGALAGSKITYSDEPILLGRRMAVDLLAPHAERPAGRR